MIAVASAAVTADDVLNLLIYLFTSFTLYILLTLHASSASSVSSTSATLTTSIINIISSECNASPKHNITLKVQLKLIISQKFKEQIQSMIYLYINIKLIYRADIYSIIIKYKFIINISNIKFCHCHIKKA